MIKVPNVHAQRPNGQGALKCSITENAKPAKGSIVFWPAGEKPEHESARPCPGTFNLSAGTYEIDVALDGVLDRPVVRKKVTIQAGKETSVDTVFDSGSILIVAKTKGQTRAGIVTIKRQGKTVATGGLGTKLRLSVGTYEVEVQSRGTTYQVKDVVLTRMEEKTVNVDFSR